MNRLKSIAYNGHTTSYTYRPDGMRATKSVDTVLTRQYLYDGQSLVAEKDGSDTLKVSYTNGLNEVISRTEYGESTNTIFFLYDANCSVNAIVDEDGELVKTFDYEEFGLAHPSPNVGQTYDSGNQNAANNKLLFAGGVGHLTDESGLIYMRARYYDPASGRFISEDPGRHGTNWYAYCGNNPANAIDLTGRAPIIPALAIADLQVMALAAFLAIAHSGVQPEDLESAYGALMDFMEGSDMALGILDALSVIALTLEETCATLGASIALERLSMLGSFGVKLEVYTEAWAAREEYYLDMIDWEDY